MPWVKGQSGNPRGGPPGGYPGCGRPKNELIEKIKNVGDPLKVIKMFYDASQDTSITMKDRLRAGELYMDRVLGQPVQQYENVTDQNENDRRIIESLRKIFEG